MRLFVIGPQRNSKFRIHEIYHLTEWCCSPCQAQNSECLRHSPLCPPLCLMRKCCCSPCQDQNFEVWCGTTTIVVIKIIKKTSVIISIIGVHDFCSSSSSCIFVQNASNSKHSGSSWFCLFSTTSNFSSYFQRKPYILLRWCFLYSSQLSPRSQFWWKTQHNIHIFRSPEIICSHVGFIATTKMIKFSSNYKHSWNA